MENILDLLKGSQGQALISGLGQQLGIDQNKSSSALSAAIPMLLGALKNNSNQQNGAESLLNALSQPQHQGSLLDQLGDVLGGDQINSDVLNDGAGILKHMFGGQEQQAANALSQSNGFDMNTAMNILKVAAPVVMSYLGKKTQQNGVSDQKDLDDILGGFLGNQASAQQDLAAKLQDFDNNDSTVEDLAGMLLNNDSLGKNIGGILGSFLK